ncbi:hypothetical protein HJA83_09870 [Rhizobium bangladeshense]|uniref:hypothetical protein n=1 Tax=Rhizobium bangladeshense TaxID=1138189 RepID=UPI001C82EF38|nr:hypothetical protein [Rhizobium bangladeshense]MBX4901641.1 hypothetical protein [Rhizobium bangladeshense]
MTTTETQIAAWETYWLAKRKADKTLDFVDRRAAALAWKFVAVFVVERPTTLIDHVISYKVALSPAHKVHPPGGAR